MLATDLKGSNVLVGSEKGDDEQGMDGEEVFKTVIATVVKDNPHFKDVLAEFI